MKKSAILLLSLVLIITCQSLLAYGQGAVGIGLQLIDTSGPIIGLITPINTSGSINGNITFFYNVSDASNVSNCSLIINSKINLTNKSIAKLPSENFFKGDDLPVGRYNWSINCTDNLSNVGESPIRTVVVHIASNFNGTNLSAVDIRNITNFVIEIPGFGRINFSNETIDLSQGFDLNNHINISFNKIELDSNVLSPLNKSATLQITGLTFSNPRIARDGVVCPDTICKKVSYSGGVLTFNVTHFTSYEAEETPSGSPASTGGGTTGGGSSGGGGGGGGGPPAVPIITDFSVDKTTLKVMLKQGQTKTETLSIKNTGTTIFDIKAYLADIEKFKVSPEISEITSTLSPNEKRTIELVFRALENEKPDIYPGKITLKSPSSEKEIATVVEVDSAEPLFDVDVDVLADSKKIFAGEEILLEVNLFNVRGFGRVDVGVEYSIKDLKGNLVATEHETLAVETQAKFTRALLVPSDLRPGTYVAFVKVTYADSVGTSSDLFEVKAKTIRLYPIQIKDYRLFLFGAAIILIVGILVFSAYRLGYLKRKMPKAKVEEIKELMDEEKTQKLKKELEALEEAHKSGFISQESYQKDKKRVEERLKSLK